MFSAKVIKEVVENLGTIDSVFDDKNVNTKTNIKPNITNNHYTIFQ